MNIRDILSDAETWSFFAVNVIILNLNRKYPFTRGSKENLYTQQKLCLAVNMPKLIVLSGKKILNYKYVTRI